MSYDQNNDQELEFPEDEVEVAENEAKVIITLSRNGDEVDGYVDVYEGVEFDPGDTEDGSGVDTLRLAAELVLYAAGYNEDEVTEFLDTAGRGEPQVAEPDAAEERP